MLPAMNASSFNIWVFIHFMSLICLAIYGMHRIWMLFSWQKIASLDAAKRICDFEDHPDVTIQLPLYNEMFVARRIIDSVAALDWPVDRLHIQVLDDSTDETSGISEECVNYWRRTGIDIIHIRRADRNGFKAGALSEGLKKTDSPFIGVFDADFIPSPDFLKKIMPCFDDKDVGMVQARWDFINSGFSFLTRLQHILLAPHFEIEHQVRCSGSLFFNFNGTAGVWRRQAIEDAGGWEADTVTEDLDLSYRAQIRGWRFLYANDVIVPSELPVTLSSFRSQQQRWAKGSMQTARKILPIISRSGLPWAVKAEAFMHLLANSGWLFGTLVTLTLYPTLKARISIGPYQIIWVDIPLFVFSGLAIVFYYFFYAIKTKRFSLIPVLPLIPILSIGLAPSITISIIKGLFTRGGVFERTPKYGIVKKEKAEASFIYKRPVIPYLFLNSAFFICSLMPLSFAYQRETWPAIPFLSLFAAGFVFVLCLDILTLLPDQRKHLGSPDMA